MVLRFITSAQIRWGLLRHRLEEDRGATAVEYALMLAFIAAVIVGAVTLLGQGTNSGLQTVQFPP
jgi:pilus assembly protein Flp/PilA